MRFRSLVPITLTSALTLAAVAVADDANAAPAPAATQAPAAQPASSAPRTHVYLVPHQDDEVLSMGATIRRSISERGAANVHVVLMTTGQSSAARTALARGVRPNGSTTLVRRSLSTTQFAAARDAEFRAAVTRLGVPARNVHLSLPRWKRVSDGALTNATSAGFVNAAIDRFGRAAGYNTMSDVDPSADHRALGSQLRRIGVARKVARMTFHYPQYQLPAPRSLTRVAPRTAADRAAIRAAAREYGVVKPTANRWGIGWISVATAFGGDALGVWQKRVNGSVWKPTALNAPATSLFDTLVSYTHS